MKRPFIVCTMALLAAAGVAQGPVHVDYAAPNSSQNAVAETSRPPHVPSVPPIASAPTAPGSNAPVSNPPGTPPPVLNLPPPSVPSPPAAMPTAERDPVRVVDSTTHPKVASASGLPPPPRNSDVPPPRGDTPGDVARAPLQPAPAVPRVQQPIDLTQKNGSAVPVMAERPAAQAASRSPPKPKPQPRAEPLRAAEVPPRLATQKSAPQARGAASQAPWLYSRLSLPPPPKPQTAISSLSRTLARTLARTKPNRLQAVALPPLAYAYAPPPRLMPAPRRAPAPRLQ
jgi:hypothetical protein